MAKTLFEDGNITTRVPGTRLVASWLNKVFNHRHDGRDQDGSAPLDFAQDTGAVNAVVAALTPALEAPVVGLPIYIKIAHTNTGPVTVNLNGLGAHSLHKLGGVELAAGDLQETQIVQIAWDGANWQLISYNSPPETDATTLQGQGAAMLAPPGMKGDFWMPTVPAGWLLCDGRAVLRAQYPALYAAIGTTHGAGDNVSTFNLPEGRGEFFRGWDNGRGVDAGREFGSFQADEVGSHNHIVDFTGHTSSGTDGGGNIGSGGNGAEAIASLETRAAGGTETRPRNIAVLVCIKY